MSNIQYPISNVQGVRGVGVSTTAYFTSPEWREFVKSFGHSGDQRPANVLTPDPRTTWTFEIGYWIFDIPYVVLIISAGFAGNTKRAARPFKNHAVGHEFCIYPTFHGLFGCSKLSSKSK